jgi:predicted dehydrogenase
MGIKVGIAGVNSFGDHFINIFQKHPFVDAVYLADTDTELLKQQAKRFEIETTFSDFDGFLTSDVDAVAIFTPRWTHGPMAVKALNAGKHVYCAVPMGATLEELEQIIEAVNRTGLIYNLGETSYYRPQSIYCRERFVKGDFGEFVYGEGQYHHDMAHFYNPFKSVGEEWKRYASVPPMWYPTHSVSHVLSITGASMTKASCFGFSENHPDGIFNKELSAFDNDFSNQSALFRTSDGGMARINEFRRIGAGESRMTIMGTNSAYEEQTDNCIWTAKDVDEWETSFSTAKENAFQRHLRYEGQLKDDAERKEKADDANDEPVAIMNKALAKEDISYIRKCSGIEITKENLGSLPDKYIGEKWLGVNKLHPVHLLPEEYVNCETGHSGSHIFLVHDFVSAIEQNKLPPNHAWAGARYNAPGIVAHESSLREGELLEIPQYGKAPDKWDLLDWVVYR